MKMMVAAAFVLATVSGPALLAKEPIKTNSAVNEDVGVPVFPYDITDRPYTVLGEVKAGVRKATIFSKEASQAKIYRELWERAEKLGADAVVNAKYGDSHISAFSWGKTNATGTAIKFSGPAKASETSAPPAAPAPEGAPAAATTGAPTASAQ
jgi:uncharacterized protein YbjQ (UPF0145 family)